MNNKPDNLVKRVRVKLSKIVLFPVRGVTKLLKIIVQFTSGLFRAVSALLDLVFRLYLGLLMLPFRITDKIVELVLKCLQRLKQIILLIFTSFKQLITAILSFLSDLLEGPRKLIDGIVRWRDVWRSSKQYSREHPTVRRNAHELEFLPAALEILEKPASPYIRNFSIGICLFFILALTWSYFGKVDVVAEARGSVIPQGRVKTIQPKSGGIVRDIHVSDGERVSEGQLLIELDPSETFADLNALKHSKLVSEVEVARIEALLSLIDNYKNELVLKHNVSDELAGVTLARIESTMKSYTQRLSDLAAQEAETKIQMDMAEEAIVRDEALLPLVEERFEAIDTLMKKGNVSRSIWAQVQERLLQVDHGLRIQKLQLERAKEKHSQAKRQQTLLYERTKEEFLKQLTVEWARLENISSQLEKAEARKRQLFLRSPVTGVVHKLSANTVGGVVTPAQELMIVVPQDAALIVDVQISNKDIGFVEVGQRVALKIDSFPYTKFGLLEGEIVKISANSVEKSEFGATESTFPAQIRLDKTTMKVGSKEVGLTPGMTVTAEIKIGQRRIIEFFLSPFLKYKAESFKER